MTRLLILALLLVPVLALAEDASQTTPEHATLMHVGDEAPAFAVEMVGSETFDLSAQRGEVVLVNHWAALCPRCVEEMPHLRDEAFRRFKDEKFAMICVSREETSERIAAFAKKKGWSELPMSGDVDRSIYSQYADHTTPRNFVLDHDGTVIFQSIGFEEPDFEKMIEVIGMALSREAR